MMGATPTGSGSQAAPEAASASSPSVSFPSAARMFVVGDIHGCLDELENKLSLLGFDKSKDKLFALGDLVDRGPKSAEVFALLDEPWFESIRGNHEELLIEAETGNCDMHVCNGGAWFAMLSPEERKLLAAKATALPIAMTVITPSGRRVGLVHADMPGADWGTFMDMLDTPQVRDYAMWTRHRVYEALHNRYLEPIRGVDHVYFGHTPLKRPVHAANMSWIDTCCFATGNLTVEELL